MTARNDRPVADAAQETLDAVASSAIQLANNAGERPRRVSVRHGDTSIEIEWDDQTAAPPPQPAAPAPAAAPPPGPAPADPETDDAHYIRAPVVGTFYHAPGPDSRPFVTEGDDIEAGAQIGIVEAMKLMNAIESDAAGRVTRILVPDGTPVEYDQPLVALLPAGTAGGA